MTETVDADARSPDDVARRLAGLTVQIDAMQAVLVRLLQDVVRADTRDDTRRSQQVAAVNENLIVSALMSRDEAEANARALEELMQSSRLDPLTGLPDRRTLLDHFMQATAAARRHDGRCALLFIDIDRFKALNDRFGHAAGDAVLRLVASRLSSAVREIDTVCRYGGDEFVAVLSELAEPGDAAAVAQKLAAVISEPADVAGHTLRLSASIGVAIYPDDGDTFDVLLTHADAAMYAAKRDVSPVPEAEDEARSGPSLDRGELPGTVGGAQPRAPLSVADRHLEQLREANERLIVAALSAQELHAAAERARQRQASFLTAVAEELRDPMAPIRIAATMLGRPQADASLLPHVQSIVERHLIQISRLVDAMNTEVGGLGIARTPVDMVRVVTGAITANRRAMDSRRQKCTFVPPAGAVTVTGDVGRLSLVVSNLLDNASRYTHHGGRIAVALEVAGDVVTLTVSDNGIGIDAPALLLIFEPFHQDPRALAFNDVGLGIGLTVARALVHAHGGTITAHSEGAGRGSRFVITLPRTPGPSDDAAGTAGPGGPGSAS
jgi:diguanylate cyclase (GGDEF)-like protein